MMTDGSVPKWIQLHHRYLMLTFHEKKNMKLSWNTLFNRLIKCAYNALKCCLHCMFNVCIDLSLKLFTFKPQFQKKEYFFCS